jgi:hypothetical protein
MCGKTNESSWGNVLRCNELVMIGNQKRTEGLDSGEKEEFYVMWLKGQNGKEY